MYRESESLLEVLAKYWFSIIDNLQIKNLLISFKQEIEGLTLHGQFVDTFQFIKYQNNSIFFNGITTNNNSQIVFDIPKSFELFVKYNLNIASIEKIADNLNSFNDISSVLLKFYDIIQSSSMMIHEEGCVRYS